MLLDHLLDHCLAIEIHLVHHIQPGHRQSRRRHSWLWLSLPTFAFRLTLSFSSCLGFPELAPVPATCDSVEALLRHELLAHIPEWLSRKAGVLLCTSSHTILFICWKEIFPNEDATRFDLVDELYIVPAK